MEAGGYLTDISSQIFGEYLEWKKASVTKRDRTPDYAQMWQSRVVDVFRWTIGALYPHQAIAIYHFPLGT